MDYQDYSRDQLIGRILDLERLNQELLQEKQQEDRLSYAWTGNLGHWYWSVETNSVTFNPLKVTSLGYDESEIPENVTYQFFTDKLHPDDYPKTMQAMLDHLHGKAAVYETEYRIKTKQGDYKWYYDRGKVTQYDANGKPAFLAGIVFDITEKKENELDLKKKNRLLSQMSSVDGLTKISNHRTLIDYLKSMKDRADYTGQPLSVALFDIDDFKSVNDRKGHIYGDQVLVQIASILKDSVRDTDMAGRYGGEEFMIVFPDTDLDRAIKISDRIRQSVERFSFFDDISVTISCGIRQYQSETVTEMIDAADKNLYQAKRNGKNQVFG